MRKKNNKFNLADHLEMFHLLFDANNIGITVVQPDGTIIYYNAAQGMLDSLSPDKVLGRSICDVYLFTREDSPTMQALDTGETISDQVHFYRTRHGKLVNSTCDVYPLFHEGALVGAMCCIHGYSLVDKQICGLVDIGQHEGSESGAAQPLPAAKKSRYRFSSLIGKSELLKEAINMATQAAKTVSPVMLVGETGVGKEIFAQSIHYTSSRGKHAYTAINCSAVPENLLEGILFGTTKGAFTGAIDKAGLFEMSHKGTLFLDELDSMPISLQSKLLRVLQEKQVRRIGDSRERELDVRIISSVSRNPITCVEKGLLRPDFYYRLGVVKVFIPPLRERLEDLHLLAQHFVTKHSGHLGIEPPLITPEAMGVLYGHSWPGNVRELEHVIEASLNILEGGGGIEPAHLHRACPDIFLEEDVLPSKTTPWRAYQAYLQREPEQTKEEAPPAEQQPRQEASPTTGASDSYSQTGLLDIKENLEVETICTALQATAGNMALAARLMKISPQLMQYKTRRYGIDAKTYKPDSF